MESRFLTNYTETTFLSTIQMNLRRCKAFDFSVSFIKKAGLVLLSKDIKAAVERGAKGRIITSTYQNFTDVESLNFFMSLTRYPNFECHLDVNASMMRKTILPMDSTLRAISSRWKMESRWLWVHLISPAMLC